MVLNVPAYNMKRVMAIYRVVIFDRGLLVQPRPAPRKQPCSMPQAQGGQGADSTRIGVP